MNGRWAKCHGDRKFREKRTRRKKIPDGGNTTEEAEQLRPNCNDLHHKCESEGREDWDSKKRKKVVISRCKSKVRAAQKKYMACETAGKAKLQLCKPVIGMARETAVKAKLQLCKPVIGSACIILCFFAIKSGN